MAALDEFGAILGIPRTLFLTDGITIVGVVTDPCAFTIVYGPCPVPLPLPALLPSGLRGFVQIVYKPPGPAVDATNGLSFTIGAP